MMNGKIISACEQERFTLDKHSRQFPIDAINECLKIGKITISEVDEIALSFDVNYHIREVYLKPALEHDYRIDFLINDIEKIKNDRGMIELIRSETGFNKNIRCYLHHFCHAASAYYPSGFSESLIFSIDGMGERKTYFSQ